MIQTSVTKTERSSNIELFRIVTMLLIVAHHYVVNSGLMTVMEDNLYDSRTVYLLLFGMWGKTGINCFVLITGWFMCTSKITLRKFLKLLLEVCFYNIVIGGIFQIVGYQQFAWGGVLRMLWPIWSVSDGFTSCFLLFYLFIPFLNILLHNMNRIQHLTLLCLCLAIYTVLGSVPMVKVQMNYVVWFSVLYVLAAYLRLYPSPVLDNGSFWGWMTLAAITLAIGSVLLFSYVSFPTRFLTFDIYVDSYYLVADSNKLLALAVSICSFLWFKNMRLPQSKLINSVAASTFGVLLIHANSDTMRQWLWKDTLDNVGQYVASLPQLVLSSASSVIAVFVVCVLIDKVRILCFERPFFKWYDRKLISSND